MILFFSGGGSPWIPELQMKEPTMMLSYYSNVILNKDVPDTRIARVMKARRKAKAKGTKKGKK